MKLEFENSCNSGRILIGEPRTFKDANKMIEDYLNDNKIEFGHLSVSETLNGEIRYTYGELIESFYLSSDRPLSLIDIKKENARKGKRGRHGK